MHYEVDCQWFVYTEEMASHNLDLVGRDPFPKHFYSGNSVFRHAGVFPAGDPVEEGDGCGSLLGCQVYNHAQHKHGRKQSCKHRNRRERSQVKLFFNRVLEQIIS